MKQRNFHLNDLTAVVYCGDAIARLKSMADKSVHAIITDLPYGVELGTRPARGNKRKAVYAEDFADTSAELETLVAAFMPQALRVASVVAITPGFNNIHLYPKPNHIGAAYFPSGQGFCSWGFSCWQPMLYYGKDPKGKGRYPDSKHFSVTKSAVDTKHPCPKPLQWWEWLINRASLPGQTIMDPFCGSGTTVEACLRLGRHVIAGDRAEAYYAETVTRTERSILELGQGFDAPGRGVGKMRGGFCKPVK